MTAQRMTIEFQRSEFQPNFNRITAKQMTFHVGWIKTHSPKTIQFSRFQRDKIYETL